MGLKKQTFIQGAAVIAIAHVFVKIIGAIYKIPLSRFVLGPDGMGIYNASYTIYNALFIISTAGLPVAISKMTSESLASGKNIQAQKIFKIALMILFVLGIVGAGILFFGAKYFANTLKFSSAYIAIAAMAPGLFFVSVMSAYRGYFQGHSNMIPTAISEVIEASGKLFIGLFLSYALLSKGKAVSAAGAILGVSTGTFLSAVFLVWYYYKKRNDMPGYVAVKNGAKEESDTYKALGIKLIKLAVPITIGASVFTLASVIDLTMISNRLSVLGYTLKERETMYGYYAAHAVTMFNLPPTLIASLSISIVPAVAVAFAKNDNTLARKTIEAAVRITILFALPCAIGMGVLSEPILNIVFDDNGAATLLSILSIGMFLVSLVMTTNSIIQAKGKVWIPVINMCLGGLLKVFINYYLVYFFIFYIL